MTPLNSTLLRKFIKRAGDQLSGDWILIGGTLLPLLGIDYRVTTDIDLIPLGNRKGNEGLLDLMKLAESLGLPVETINSAGLYFLEKIQGYSQQLLVLHRGRSATIYRPNINLFIHLKIGRMTESDLSDCLQMIQITHSQKEPMDPALVELIDRELKTHRDNAARIDKLEELRKAVLKKLRKTDAQGAPGDNFRKHPS